MRCVLGFDGGGTKTECVLVDDMGEIRARTVAGPSNPVNVGIEMAAREIAEAGNDALLAVGLANTDVGEILAGVAGAGQRNVNEGLQQAVRNYFPKANVSIVSDLELSLSATGEKTSIVVLGGTGSAALGRTADGRTARAGGLGPILGDPGSAYDLGRRTLSLAMARNLNREKFLLEAALLEWGKCSLPELADKARANPTRIFPGIFPLVAEAAERGDGDAADLLKKTAEELFALAEAVVEQLQLREQKFFVGWTGGVFAGSALVRGEFDRLVRGYTLHAHVGPLPRSVAETAARMALEAMKN